MRLEVRMLSRSSTVNSLKYVPTVDMARGETLSLMFQLFDADTGVRYVPAAGATVQVQVPRYLEYVPTLQGDASAVDYSVNQPATQPFSGDSSIWSTPLTSTQTAKMTSQNAKFVLTEGSVVTIASVKYAIRVASDQE